VVRVEDQMGVHVEEGLHHSEVAEEEEEAAVPLTSLLMLAAVAVVAVAAAVAGGVQVAESELLQDKRCENSIKPSL
jgi:hypothetical protein